MSLSISVPLTLFLYYKQVLVNNHYIIWYITWEPLYDNFSWYKKNQITLYDTKKVGSIVLTVGTVNSDNSNTQRKQKIVRIITCLIY